MGVKVQTKKVFSGATALSREVGMSLTWVSNKLRQGLTSAQIKQEAKRPKKKGTHSTRGRMNPRSNANHEPGSEESVDDSIDPETGEESFYSAQARKERAVASKHELELAQMRGELLPVAHINSWFSNVIVKARDVLMNVPADLGDRIAQETDPVVCREILEKEVRRVLTELGDYAKLTSAAIDGQGVVDSSQAAVGAVKKRQDQESVPGAGLPVRQKGARNKGRKAK